MQYIVMLNELNPWMFLANRQVETARSGDGAEEPNSKSRLALTLASLLAYPAQCPPVYEDQHLATNASTIQGCNAFMKVSVRYAHLAKEVAPLFLDAIVFQMGSPRSPPFVLLPLSLAAIDRKQNREEIDPTSVRGTSANICRPFFCRASF